MNDLMRQAYIIQILYHKTFLDVNEGFQYFTQHFDKAIDLWQSSYARTLLQEIHKFRKSLSAHQRADLVMGEARLFMKEENPEMARLYYTQLLDEAAKDWAEIHKAQILLDLGECYQVLAQFDEAFNAFHNALALERERNNQQKIADILNSLGYISRRQGKFSQAVDYYQESFRIYKGLGGQPEYLREIADILNNLANVSRLLGKMEEALIYCQKGLQIRERLLRNHQGSEVAIGFSHASLGYIYLSKGADVKAGYYLKEAFDVFTRTNNKRGLAAVCNRLSIIHIKLGETEKALESLKRAFDLAAHIDEEAQVTSLNRQARIHLLQDELSNARSILEQAVNQALHAHDYYQEAESRIDLARALAILREQEQYSQQLVQATVIAKQQNYNKLLGEIEKLQGEVAYQQRQYAVAFLHFAVFCHFMAEFNPMEYSEALQFLIDALLGMDDPTALSKSLDVLRSYWGKQQLESRYPELLNVCRNVGEMNL